jgi:putative ABC transport system permease protein
VLARYSARELLHHPLRTSLAVAGVAVATAMLLDMLMLGTGLERSFDELIRARGYELRISPKGTLPFDTRATVPGAATLRDSVAGHPDVAGVAPVLAANLLADPEPGPGGSAADGRADAGPRSGAAGDPLRVFVLGVDPDEQGLYRLVDGTPPSGPGDLVLSAEAGDALGAGRGDTVRLSAGDALGGAAAARSFRVTGRADFLYASRDERPAAARMDAVAGLTGRPDRVSFLMVRLEAGADPDSVAAELSGALPHLEVASAGQLVERARDRLSYFRQLAFILGTVSLLVAGLLVGTIMAVSVSERYGTIAVLRAVGVSRRSVVAALAAESLALCAVAGLLGLGLGALTARWLETVLADFPGLPRAVRFFVLRPADLATAWAAVLAVGVASALLPAWRAAGMEVAPALHREEP